MESAEIDDNVFELPGNKTKMPNAKISERRPFFERPSFVQQLSIVSIRNQKSYHSAVELNGSHLSIVDKTLLQNESESAYANMPKC